MGTTPDDGLAFEVTQSLDITKLPLTTEEGFVVSRIMGRRVTLADLVRESVVAPARVRVVVESLMKKGALSLLSRKNGEADPYAGIIFSPADMADAPDLTEEQKKRVLFFDMNLERYSHYALLGLKRTASVADIKAGYFRVSKEFHPDAFFRKDLGKFKERLDRIFKAMKRAYDTLSDPVRRSEYDANLIGELSPEEEAELIRIAAEKRKDIEAKERDARNELRRREQRVKHNPMVERIQKGRDYLRLAEEAVRANKLQEAERHARLAVEYAPHDGGLRSRAQQIILDGQRDRMRTLVKRAHNLLEMHDARDPEVGAELTKLCDQIAECAGNDGPLLVDAAKLLVRAGKTSRAFKLAQQAIEADSGLIAAWELSHECAAAEQKWHLALKAAEKLVELSPKEPRFKDWLKAARKKSS